MKIAAGLVFASLSWFGLPVPTGLSPPHKPVIDVSHVKVKPATVPAGEESFPELNGARIHRDVEKVVSFSKASHSAGDKVWGRVTGFPAALATDEWIAKEFKAAGLENVSVQEYDQSDVTSLWWSKHWNARVIASSDYGAGSKDVELASAVPASGSMIEGGSLEGELVDAGAVTEPLPDVDVKGKIAVQRLHPQAGAYSERTATVQRAQALTKRGAIATLNVVEQLGNMHVRDFGNCGAPCFNLGTADGAFLRSAMTRVAETHTSPLKVHLELEAEELIGLKGHNVMGVVRGRSDEVIIVNAHADGWFDAAGDNGDGIAVLLALARHFAQPAHKPARTLVFVASGGHHSNGLNGPQHWIPMNPEIVPHVVMVVNLEHVAQLYIRPDPWRVEATEQPMNFGISNMAPFLVDLAKRGAERYGFNLIPEFTRDVPGDLGGYAKLGVARIQAIHSGPMYHTSGDVVETISVPGLERAARFYEFFVREAAAAPRNSLERR